jgi:hypothetical protein
LGYFHDINNDSYDSNNDSNDRGGAKKTKSMAQNVEEKHNLLLRMVSTLHKYCWADVDIYHWMVVFIKSDIRLQQLHYSKNNNKCKKTTKINDKQVKGMMPTQMVAAYRSMLTTKSTTTIPMTTIVQGGVDLVVIQHKCHIVLRHMLPYWH